MEPWLLNWTAWVARNTQAEFDGITYEDGPEWFDRMWDSWLAHSDYGYELKKNKTNNKSVIKVDLSDCKNMKECSQVVELIASGKVKIIIENNNE